MVSQRRLRELYTDRVFLRGAYLSNTAFRKALKKEYGIKVTAKEVDDALGPYEVYFQSKDKSVEFERRKYDVQGSFQVFQTDLAEVRVNVPDLGTNTVLDKEKYFLVVIDAGSSHLWTYPLKDKTARTVWSKFEELFAHLSVLPQKIVSDLGSEFVGNRKKFQERGILWRQSRGYVSSPICQVL